MLQTTLRRFSSAALVVSFASTSAFASSNYTVNPESLRTALYSGNTDVYNGLNNLYRAKEEVTRARTNLLPALNIGGVLNGSPSFASATIGVLLPFLLPSNWHALDASRKTLTANGYAYQLVLLNTYASILSVYAQIQGDQALRAVYVTNRDNLRQIAQAVADEVSVGTALQSDLAQAEAQVQIAETQINNIDAALAREIAALRQAMGLSLSNRLVIAPYHFSELDAESSSATSLLAKAKDRAPELDQIDSLIEAAKQTKYANEWSFLSGASLATSVDFSKGSFGRLTAGGSVNLGFGILPAVHLSSLDVAAMNIRKREINLELQNASETAIGAVNASKQAVQNARLARDNYQIALQAELDKLKLGQSTLISVFTTANFAVTAGVNYAQAVTELDNQRINLNRILITNQFSKIPTCHLQGKLPHGGVGGFFRSIFGGKKKRYISIDEMCRPSSAAASAANGSMDDN